MDAQTKKARAAGAANFWYKDAIIYQLHVKSFFDSNNDGIGDFRDWFQNSTTLPTSA